MKNRNYILSLLALPLLINASTFAACAEEKPATEEKTAAVAKEAEKVEAKTAAPVAETAKAEAAPLTNVMNGIQWSKSASEVNTRAQASGKLIMADFYTTWCGWCTKLDQETYVDSRVVLLADEFV